jgi:hypothetical protein
MLNKKNFKEKSYNRCLFCDHRGVSCNGPRTSDMTLERWREFMRDMKEVEGLTYADIAARSGYPAKTIEKKLAPGGDGQDIMRETARAIEQAILGSTQHPCYMAFLESAPDSKKGVTDLEAEIARLHRDIELLHQSYKEELNTVRTEAQAKVNYLRAENEKKDKIIDRLLK